MRLSNLFELYKPNRHTPYPSIKGLWPNTFIVFPLPTVAPWSLLRKQPATVAEQNMIRRGDPRVNCLKNVSIYAGYAESARASVSTFYPACPQRFSYNENSPDIICSGSL